MTQPDHSTGSPSASDEASIAVPLLAPVNHFIVLFLHDKVDFLKM